MNRDKVRVAVVGDSGVGKTTFLQHMCADETSEIGDWTVGCSVFVKQQQTYAMNGTSRSHFVEFWDIGGHRNYESSRSVFYDNLNGIIFMYDVTNIKSFNNLREWIDEIGQANRVKPGGVEEQQYVSTPAMDHNNSQVKSRYNSGALPSTSSQGSDGIDIVMSPSSPENQHKVLGDIPVLVVGTKCDLRAKRIPSSYKTFGIESITVSAKSDAQQQAEKLTPFLQRVIDRKFFPQEFRQRAKHSPAYVPSPVIGGVPQTLMMRTPDLSDRPGSRAPTSSSMFSWLSSPFAGSRKKDSSKVVDDRDHIL